MQIHLDECLAALAMLRARPQMNRLVTSSQPRRYNRHALNHSEVTRLQSLIMQNIRARKILKAHAKSH